MMVGVALTGFVFVTVVGAAAGIVVGAWVLRCLVPLRVSVLR